LKQSQSNYKRIVIKIGSSLFCGQGQTLDLRYLHSVVEQVALEVVQGKEIVLVSSGAIALGMNVMGLGSRPSDLPYLQAIAAIGQNALMDNYSAGFSKNKVKCAQVLLTWDDFSSRARYLNAKNTLLKLLKLGVVPVINENDTISTDEIRFGDNDRLSALVASLINADLLVILSDVDGLLDKEKKVISVVEEINSQIKGLACPTTKKSCVGGMITKLEAAKIAVDSGVPCVIANGRRKNIFSAQSQGTLFLPKANLAAKKRWIAFSAKAKGRIVVDDGAKAALENKKSLLSVGVIAVTGSFNAKDVVSITDKKNCEFAKGRAAVSSKELDKVKGVRFEKEIIHRDNIAIL